MVLGSLAGSSPLTRGKHLALICALPEQGLIPAHAGKTPALRYRDLVRRAHPRSRGENLLLVLPSGSIQGSSPLTRGKLTVKVSAHNFIGLIPAHAGKTGKTDVALEELGAHPRSRGENAYPLMAAITHPGSSPLTRGKREILLCEVLAGRLIPAHAGKTSSGSRPPAPPRAHPRSRGENPPFASWNALMAGSSPLTRGKQNRASISMPASGLIPAHAGKTRPFRPMRPAVWAHPRSRGENLIPGCLIAPGAGSSPLTRGKQAGTRNGHGPRGLIPAHAGKT